MMTTRTTRAAARKQDADCDKRSRILHAAMDAFREHGFATATTLEIATRAHVSKRELYGLVGNKEAMLKACIAQRVGRFGMPKDTPTPRDRDALARILASFGAQLVREVSDAAVIAVFRLAIGEAVNAPEVARTLDATGRATARAALHGIMAHALASDLLTGEPDHLAEQFRGLLWGDLMISLLLGVAERPRPGEIARRARSAVTAFLALHPVPNDAATGRAHLPKGVA
jgi:AcrR family transcriptional regulator